MFGFYEIGVFFAFIIVIWANIRGYLNDSEYLNITEVILSVTILPWASWLVVISIGAGLAIENFIKENK